MDTKQLIFALDIGTRSVIGVVCAQKGDVFEVLCVESAEHTERAMIDGQIENIEQTARVARMVKKAVEDKIGVPLQDVHVAAAGRILRTQKASCEMDVGDLPVNRRQMFTLESRAVQKAFEELMQGQEEGGISFCCAGYSVTQYTLDGYSFSTLLGHRGKKARVEIIATFLPDEVIESLYTTMARTGLSVASVTLEPIAAMNAVIPQELRLLNIALVDIGAGTSDIAISNGGSVVAYTMSTVAGDEITEQTMRELLVDFRAAEQIKRDAGLEETQQLTYQDILGNTYTIGKEAFLEKIQPAVDQLAESIAQKILEANGGPPTATFLVGGGSRTPGLKPAVARTLGVEENKVAIGGINYIKRSVAADEKYLSVEYATPVGIAITAIRNSDQEEATVLLNDKRVRMLGSSTMRVLDVLLRGGYEYRRIMGHSGQSLAFELNGEARKLRGGIQTLARIEVNGVPAGISSPVQEGDKVLFVPAQDGEDAHAVLRDVVGDAPGFEIRLFGEPRRVGALVRVNGVEQGLDYEIRPQDRIELETVDTVGALLEAEQLMIAPEDLARNGAPCQVEDILCEGDSITLAKPAPLPVPAPPAPVEAALPPQEELEAAQDREAEPAPQPPQTGGVMRIELNSRHIALPPKADGQPYQFFDLLNFVTDIDLGKPEGKAVLKKNGTSVSFLETIREGDHVQIYWEK